MRIAFVHPDLGIGGAERLVVDAALGLKNRGHVVDIYTSHHDPKHCFDETRNGELNVKNITPPFPRAFRGKFHILFAHLRQLHLATHFLSNSAQNYDVFVVDQLSTCVPFIRLLGRTRVVFYCHFPDKLLANGEFVDGVLANKRGGLLKRLYRFPMDWLEEITTRQADIILANSGFTARIFKSYFTSIQQTPRIVHPGINISLYDTHVDINDPDVEALDLSVPSVISINRFEKKKNAALAVQAFAIARKNHPNIRLVLAGGYDPRLEDNMMTLYSLVDLVKSNSLTFNLITPASSSGKPVQLPPLNMTPTNPDALFLLNFTTAQRTALLKSSNTRALLYTPANEHFGIVPVEAMICGVPVIACNSGGPTESVLDDDSARTGWLRPPDLDLWADAMDKVLALSDAQRQALSQCARERAKTLFGMEAMAEKLEDALKEASGLGEVDWFDDGWRVAVMSIFGFLIAYFVGSLVVPEKWRI